MSGASSHNGDIINSGRSARVMNFGRDSTYNFHLMLCYASIQLHYRGKYTL